jgi:hypothetical protein
MAEGVIDKWAAATTGQIGNQYCHQAVGTIIAQRLKPGGQIVTVFLGEKDKYDLPHVTFYIHEPRFTPVAAKEYYLRNFTLQVRGRDLKQFAYLDMTIDIVPAHEDEHRIFDATWEFVLWYRSRSTNPLSLAEVKA